MKLENFCKHQRLAWYILAVIISIVLLYIIGKAVLTERSRGEWQTDSEYTRCLSLTLVNGNIQDAEQLCKHLRK